MDPGSLRLKTNQQRRQVNASWINIIISICYLEESQSSMSFETKRRRTAYQSYITPHSCNSRNTSTDESVAFLQRLNDSDNLSSNSRRTSALGPLHSIDETNHRAHNSTLERCSDDDLEQVIVAIDIRESGTVGCSYYSAQEERLYLLGDIRSSSNEAIDSLIEQTNPTVLLTSTRVDYLNTAQSSGQDGIHRYLPYQLDIRPSQEFGHSNAIAKLAALEVPSAHEQRIKFFVPHNGLIDPEQLGAESLGFTLQEGRLLHMASSIDMENTVTIGCAGAVLAYLQRRRTTDSITTLGFTGAYQVRSVEMFSLKGTMFINRSTLLSLHITESESHLSMLNQGPGRKSPASKEGLSVYGLFQRFAHTPQGRNRLRQIFLRPSVEINVICERHDFISVYLRPDNYDALNKIVKGLKHIKNLRPVMINLRKGISTGSAKITGFKTTVWATLLAFAFYGIDIHDALKETFGADNLNLRTQVQPSTEMLQIY